MMDNWQNDGWHSDSMTMSHDNDGMACYLHSTHATYPHPPPLSDIEPRCHIAVSDMATIQQTIDFHPCSLHGTDTAHPHQMLHHWQPFNKQLISTCPVHNTHVAHPHPPSLASRCHVAVGGVATKCWTTNVVILCCPWDGDRMRTQQQLTTPHYYCW